MNIQSQIKKALTGGLLNDYAGDNSTKRIIRAGFQGTASDYETNEIHYHDEWFAISNGGGQELVEINNSQFTRLYAGGTTNSKILSELGLTHTDVGSYLQKKLIALKDNTRLFENCIIAPDGDWQYSYYIIKANDVIEIITGEELITYKTVPVHIHMFLLTPIK